MSTSTFDSPEQPVILGFDPGRQKCGVAIMGLDRSVYYHQVIPAQEAITTIEDLRQQFPVSMVIMGNQTSANDWKQRLTEVADPPRVILVDERYTSLEARNRYWQMYPPRGFVRLLPQGMRTPPRPIDDIVAILLIERYLEQLTN